MKFAKPLIRLPDRACREFEMPSWRTGIQRRINAIPLSQIRDGLLTLFILIGLAILMISPIVLAFLTPPMVD